ncbi:MAG TPA: alpha/beta hydrolase, partial [Solirubrobacteraceae bacterium]
MLVHPGTVPAVRRRRPGRYGPLLPSATPLVLLHGFAGTPEHWRRVIAELPPKRFAPVPLDIARIEPLTPDGVVAAVAAAAPARFVLAGYSMGARLALHAALAMPERLERLVLVSGTAGIDARERGARLAADEALAEEIERGG